MPLRSRKHDTDFLMPISISPRIDLAMRATHGHTASRPLKARYAHFSRHHQASRHQRASAAFGTRLFLPAHAMPLFQPHVFRRQSAFTRNKGRDRRAGTNDTYQPAAAGAASRHQGCRRHFISRLCAFATLSSVIRASKYARRHCRAFTLSSASTRDARPRPAIS